MSRERVIVIPTTPDGPYHEAFRVATELGDGIYVSSRHPGSLDHCRAPSCKALRREVRRRAGGEG